MASVVLVATSSVEPSGAARATCEAPMAVPAPGRLSTITVRPSEEPSCCAMSRPSMSVVPPGA
ncbi:hypothetical protein D3C71_670340 [compost metagenome]